MQRRHLLQIALAASSAPAFVRNALAADTERFALGIASGTPRPDGMVLWTRLVGADLPASVTVQWEIAYDEHFTRIAARGVETALAEDAHSVHAEPAGLAPDRWYWYRFTALGQRSPVGRTRSTPTPDADVTLLRFTTASCQRWDHGHWAAWRDVATRELDCVLFLGDYIYEYATPANANVVRRHDGGATLTLDHYRRRYAQYKSDPALQAAHAFVPWICIWDDHEVQNDWAGDVGEDLSPSFPARRVAATRAYWEHMPFPKALRPDAAGDMRINTHCDWGRLARLIMLDARSHRDPQSCPKPNRAGSAFVDAAHCPGLVDPQRSLLGAAQERWLGRT
ncbi:MAG TPA: alkaline phosphatase D family protein, partial [Burkholderiaceae bacterium]